MKIAVLVPVYNASRHLCTCLDSILAQTHPDLTVCCCDDGSTDESPKILADYAARHANVVVLTQANAGVSAARNRLLDALPPDAEAFGFVDADDMVHREMYAALAQAMEREGADMAECRFQVVGNAASEPAPVRSDAGAEARTFDDLTPFLLRRTASGQWINVFNRLIRRGTLGTFRFREGLSYEEDFYYSFELHARMRRKVVLQQAYYSYRDNPESVTSRVNFGRYVSSACRRIRLSQLEFLDAGRIPAALVPTFRRELAKDAYRMCLRKNLKKNRNAAERRVQFRVAGAFLAQLRAESSFGYSGLGGVSRLICHLAEKGHYGLARLLVVLT